MPGKVDKFDSHVFKICISIPFVLAGITIAQDYLRSAFRNQAFYLSEALIFSSFWLVFLPLFYVQFVSLKKFGRPYPVKLLFIILPALFHLLLYPGLVWITSWLFYYHTYAFDQTLRYTLSEHLYVVLLFYFLSFLAHEYFKKRVSAIEQRLKNTASDPEKFITSLLVSNGVQHLKIGVSNILFIKASSPYISLHLADKKYLQKRTLKSLSEMLDGKLFIRIHKSVLINIRHVKSYKSRSNGDYDLLMSNNSSVRLSRNYADQFMKKFKDPTQATAQ